MLQYISFIHQYLLILLLIMINLKKYITFTFARSRIKREIEFDPKLKDFSSNYSIAMQEQQMRAQFEKIPTQTLTNVLKDPHPKIGKRFFIQKESLNKKIRKSYKQKVSIDLLQTHDQHDLDYLAASKSHLNDQKAEIQFQRKFKQQLFRAKETQLMLNKKQKQIDNYLPNSEKDGKYLNYLEAKKTLKNKKIKNMMELNRNNEQLQLLIQSGFANNPNNIRNIIDQISKKNQTLLSDFSVRQVQNQSKQLVDKQNQHKYQLTSVQDIGPEQLKDRAKIQQFVDKFKQQHTKDQEQCLEDLNILKSIRQYEQQLFLSRYEGINFRFKGKVEFSFFHQKQLVSYVKNEKIEPEELLLMFKQNKNELSKFKVPIITPPVLSALYSKTSLYQFAETEVNNRINMLNDPKFKELERATFKEIHKLNDIDFCSVVYAYASNHADEQGILAKRMSDKINEVIYAELSFRIFNLNDKDLGLVLRAVSKLALAKSQQNWTDIITYLQRRLPLVSQPYTIQSIFQFLLCLSYSQITHVVAQNIGMYSTFKWEETNTVLTFCHAAGLIFSQSKNIQNFIEIKKQIRDIILASQKQLFQIIQKISINRIAHFLVAFTQSQASLSLPKLGNHCKKLVIQNIKGQKQIIKEKSLVNVLNNFIFLDTQKYMESKKSKFGLTALDSDVASSLLRRLCLKQLTVFQPIPFNSSQYLIYHELATFTHSQLHNLSCSALSRILQQLALIKYKNENLLDEIARKIIENVQGMENETALSVVRKQTGNEKVKQLLGVVNSYSLQKRETYLFKQAFQLLLIPKYFNILLKQPPSVMIRFLSGVLGLIQVKQTLQKTIKSSIQKILINQLLPLLNENILNEQQISCVAFCGIMLGNYKEIQSKLSQLDLSKFKNPICKFIIKFCHEISRIGNGQSIQEGNIKQLSALEAMFYNEVQSEIQYNAMCIGQPLSYKQVYSSIATIERRKSQGKQIKQKNWIIEVPSSRKATFIASYDHLQTTQTTDKKLVLKVTGAWKLFTKYYELLGWDLKIVVSFLEGQ